MKQYIIILLSLFSIPFVQAQSLEGSFSSLGEETVTGNSGVKLTAICGQPFKASEQGDQLAYGFGEIVTTTNEASKITAISLDKATATIEAGGNYQLTATILPADADNKTVNWKSSNTTVATVSESGLVRAVTKGNATITATTASGVFAAECAITVTRSEPEPEPIPVTGVSLDQTAVTLDVKETVTLTATVKPANADSTTVSWSSSDEKIVQVDRGIVTAVAPGTAVIRVTTKDGGFQAECIVTVKDTETGVETIEHGNKIYPRLIEDILYVELQKDQTIYIIYATGKIQQIIHGQSGLNTIRMQSYPAGIYFIRLEDQTIKVIKK